MNSFDSTRSSFQRSNNPNEESNKSIQQLSPSESDNSDIEFDDTQIETPQALRESSRSMLLRTTTTEVPLNDHQSSSRKKTPTKFNAIHTDDRDLIANDKLISDDNQFTPHAMNGSPGRIPRLQWSGEKVNTTHEEDFANNVDGNSDEEFDSSDNEEARPEEEQEQKPSEAMKPKDLIEDLETRTVMRRSTLARSPRKSSPLRNEINASSSSPASEKKLPESKRSPAKVEQMLKLINSSIDRLRDADSDEEEDVEYESEPYASDEEIEFSDDEEEALNKLDTLLPSRNGSIGHRSSPAISEKEEPDFRKSHEFEQDFPSSMRPSQPSRSFSSLQESNIFDKSPSIDAINDGSPKRNGKLPSASKKRKSAKSLRSKHGAGHKSQGTPLDYPDWPQEKWSKLIQLVESSIPNSAIVTSNIVVRELGCQNKAELAKRVAFLENYLNRFT
ncbi:hypothetical protein FT663_02101 [Candidozyma haemuli var. vulneris]|uniref:Uncharacterized protein n=1 Tax=Candidozyma haemuli TaxID=45357 RepID=A0A2V1AT85_9ASCO|nr:hypothetical protein CXQ85_001931 [[Candida] haemuloni]KAF3988663.1 hypothetical protein FT662_03267 [[Candida] haemuloni var. vulneris]KAF3992942.1 hypothetical protein FT663_02101 [[Candida] haemuloni var. vulneris]PVH20151.1 hypothetical protein CXQ85_001931 [[Candida] haemuloni]